MGRYSFLGIDPFYILQGTEDEPFAKLRALLEKYKITGSRNSLPFLGGAVGYLAYDSGFLLEKKLRKILPDDLRIPEYFFGFYNSALIFDHLKKIFYIFRQSGKGDKKYP